MLKSCVLVGLDWAKSMIFLLLHATCSCIFHAYVPFFIDIDLCWYFSICPSLSLFLFLSVSCSMAPKRKSTPSWNPLRVPRNLLLLPFLILPPLTFGSVMRRPVQTSQRTFHDAIFILNAKSSYQIFSILIFPLSSTVKVRSHFVSSQSLVPP